MPLLKIQTNAAISTEQSQLLMKKASRAVAQKLGKPEQYMMVSLEGECPMTFAGSPDPAAFMELRGIGLPLGQAGELSRLLCELAQSDLGVPSARIYINFADVPSSQWGWNGKTF